MTYENAQSTILLATHCCACGRALRDAVSVEAGMGPDCRANHGYNDEPQGPADWTRTMAILDGIVEVAAVNPAQTPRKACNVLVHRAACMPRTDRTAIVEAIAALGFRTLAVALAEGAGECVTVDRVECDGRSFLAVRTPFAPAFNADLRTARIGARWNPERRAWMVPTDDRARRGLWATMCAQFAGAALVTADGVRRI